MTDAAGTKFRTCALAIVSGVAIALAGIAPWTLLAPLNATVRPDLPWAAVATVIWLTVMLVWLNGAGWPRAWRDFRRFSLRLWRPAPGAWSGENAAGILGLVGVIVATYVFWIALSPSQTPDLSAYPTPAYRISVLLTGALVSGLVEEMAFRGYMQSQLERFGPMFAIGVTSVVFVLMHATHGVMAMLVMAPGLFVASVLYGALALRCGSIVPGIVLHTAGDASHTFFSMLGGDIGLLLRP